MTEQGSVDGSLVALKVEAPNNHAVLLFRREVMAKKLRETVRDQVPTSGWSVDMLGDMQDLIEVCDGPQEGDHKAWLLRHGPEHITLVHVYDGWAHIASASHDLEGAAGTCEHVAEQVRASQADDGSVTPVTFWALNPHRFPRPMRRKVKTAAWEEITGNYHSETEDAMRELFELSETPEERMILWHGPAGTGKTHALRALARRWRSWCDVAYITDPEEFIGGVGRYSPTYLFDVANFGSGHGARAQQRGTLIVLEDAGELMTGEARIASGQGLSRLLNLTDGMMGQGLNVMVLITTNEPLSALHPAVVRPGRCLAEIEFAPLAPEQANEWLVRHDSGATVDEPTTLAVLYAIAGGHHTPRSKLAALR